MKALDGRKGAIDRRIRRPGVATRGHKLLHITSGHRGWTCDTASEQERSIPLEVCLLYTSTLPDRVPCNVIWYPARPSMWCRLCEPYRVGLMPNAGNAVSMIVLNTGVAASEPAAVPSSVM